MIQKPKISHFFVDSKKYQTNQAFLTGRQIKAIAGVTGIYHLFLKEDGDKPDRIISNGETLNLNPPEGIMSFYTHDVGF